MSTQESGDSGTTQRSTEYAVVPAADELAAHHATDEHQRLTEQHQAAQSADPVPAPGPRGGATGPTGKEHAAVSLSQLTTIGTVDPEQSQLRMVSAGNGIIYSVQADGRLVFYRHLGWQSGDTNWANGGAGVVINSGWHVFTTVLASDDGQIFAFAEDGTVRWYKYAVDLTTNTGTWAPGGGAVIGQGFDKFPRVFGGWKGVVYAVDGDGRMYWFKYLAADGSTSPSAWANGGTGLLIKSGLTFYHQFVGDQNGVIYAVKQGEELHWFKHTGANGQAVWANGGQPVPIGTGWTQEYQREIVVNAGSIYSVYNDRGYPPGTDHELYWYRLTNWQNIAVNGAPAWASNKGRLVGTGWTTCRTASLQGHTDRRSVATGRSIGVAVSSTVGQYTASVLRLEGPIPDGGATQVWGPTVVPGRLQTVQAGYRRAGTGWMNDFTVDVGADWKSGFYVTRLSGPLGMRRYAPFVVKPATPAQKVALLLPFLTHNAYNTWGGHSQYTWDIPVSNRYVSHQRPSANLSVAKTGVIDARFFSDLLLLKWLGTNNIQYDCYQDIDLHESADWLGHYKVLVLTTHPEYWTLTMRSRVIDYLAAGGRVIYTGGNGMYEPVDLVDSNTTSVHRDPHGNRIPYRDHGLPESDVLGVAYGGEYLTFQQYQVVSNHAFLAGSELSVGGRFGASGYNGAASGWEMDQSTGTNPSVQLIAKGTQAGGGAHMVFFDKGNGGWVFTAGSLSFNGALNSDARLSKVLLNAFTAAVA